MKPYKVKQLLLSIWDRIYYAKALHLVRKNTHINIMSAEETINYILEHNCSISRYGDGEFSIMLQYGAPGFQQESDKMSHALTDVFKNKPKNLLICVPRFMLSTRGVKKEGKLFWTAWSLEHQLETTDAITGMVGESYIFGDAVISRPYSPYRSNRIAKKIFPLLQKLWVGKNLLIVEGVQTRLGVGNDLFANAKSIKRILGPAKDAYNRYDDILSTVRTHWNGELVILALGPTATILASDLARSNIQALDLGHIDIQYEWFLAGADGLQPVSGKYTNEAAGGQNVAQCSDETYLSQIIDRII